MDAKPTIVVNIVTPDGSVYENSTSLVVCKTTVGEIGIMPNHIPTLAALAIDRVRVQTTEEKFDEIAVSGGFMEFSDNTLSIVASSAEKREDIDTNRAQRAKERAEKRIEEAKQTHNVDELRRAEVSLRRAINRISISNK
ncbi:F0F1 ATP synthase subunit epsilon [Ligilactobacillus sp. WILCCON 0076]|uniref:ATP synthase epsilon chain n=1 Tax=Ligilactobacillus ubinensis TaxID=2876789 RepID=A0A9X2FHX6_9LACO|nr:F0F1 ATP synthase subunit epsilon [Ligilactobacillus ubinensis]MCP0885954.1 F0F1 ATP synthase subunit epsilon [Ligilactobacillus ubinensis]